MRVEWKKILEENKKLSYWVYNYKKIKIDKTVENIFYEVI